MERDELYRRGRGNIAGGWDGCLKFEDSYIDSNGDFHGWMASSADATTGVIKWISLNSVDCDGTNCTADAAYKLYTSATFGRPPKWNAAAAARAVIATPIRIQLG